MTCQEVMEDMQRQLDGDLDERESGILMAHMRNCPECSEMFARLQRLSSELEQLPKVTPPYSLVDAILPKLAQIDASAAAGAAASGAAVGRRQHADLTESPALPDAGKPGNPDQAGEPAPARAARTAKRRQRRFAFGALGGVAAAAVVAALFIVTYQPGSFSVSDQAADVATEQAGSASEFSVSPKSASSSNSSAPAAESQSEGGAKSDSEPADTGHNQNMDKSSVFGHSAGSDTDGSGTDESQEPSADESTDSSGQNPEQSPKNERSIYSAPEETDRQRATTERQKSAGNKSVTPDSYSAGTPGRMNSALTPEAEKDAADLPDQQDGSSGTAPESGASGSGAADGGGVAEKGGTAAEDPNVPFPGIAAIPGEQSAPPMGIQAFPETMSPSDVSPDGTYKAAVRDNVVWVYKTEGGGIVFESDPKKGTISQPVWTDNKTLVYTVTTASGQTITYQVDAEAGTESELPN